MLCLLVAWFVMGLIDVVYDRKTVIVDPRLVRWWLRLPVGLLGLAVMAPFCLWKKKRYLTHERIS